jgi:hypothetical protein
MVHGSLTEVPGGRQGTNDMVEFEEKIQEYCEAREQGVIVSPFLEFSLFYLGTNIEHKI